MHRERRHFDALGINIILVGMGTLKQAELFRKVHGITFTIICDPHKNLYRAYQLHSAGVTGIVSPRVLISGLRALGKGHLPGVPAGDVLQLSGVFIIDVNAVIRYAHYSKNIADHPSAGELLRDIYRLGIHSGGAE
ncbi:MAG: redoxin domain-containing protein [Nitrospirae bacterium YQR-1]